MCVCVCAHVDWQTPPSCLKEILEQLLEAIVTFSEPSGRVVSELFQKLPSKVVRTAAGFVILTFCNHLITMYFIYLLRYAQLFIDICFVFLNLSVVLHV